MALFQINNEQLTLVKPKNFGLEKDIQTLIEINLETVFNCRFVASEFSTGSIHGGRIDTLALSEDNNPVIIEYKKVPSSELINQSLYYLSWIKDHRGDFKVIADQNLGKAVEIDWDNVRVICIAPGYKKYDLHAVQTMGANIELWQYRLFENGAFYLEEVFRRSKTIDSDMPTITNGKNPVMVAAGKKAALTRATGSYRFDEHMANVSNEIKELALDLREYILSIDESVEESPKKYYIAYKITQNFVCMEIKKNKLFLYLKINPSEIQKMPENARDVRNIGHYGTGGFELTVKNRAEYELAHEYITMSFESIGG